MDTMEPGIMMEFCGGLGNKMFQLAAGYAASKKYGCPLYVKKQQDKNHHQNMVNYYDSIFLQMGTHLSEEEYERVKKDHFPVAKNYIHNHIYQFMVSTEAYSLENLTIPVIFNQYFQYYPPLKSVERDLQQIFLKGLKKYRDLIQEQYPTNSWNRSIFLHIRRGDYLNYPDRHPITGLDYYAKCISLINKNHNIFVFSDDPLWVKQQTLFQGERIQIIENDDEIYSLAFMSKCHAGAICANSSCSWWGAFLGPHRFLNPVYVPGTWILQCEVAGLFPEEWIVV